MDGWKLVPVEPTPEMKFAGWGSHIFGRTTAYAAMLAAAPEPSPSVGMVPVAEVHPHYGLVALCDSVEVGDKLYSAEQLAILQAALGLQAEIDALMLEFCPGKMSQEQLEGD